MRLSKRVFRFKNWEIRNISFYSVVHMRLQGLVEGIWIQNVFLELMFICMEVKRN